MDKLQLLKDRLQTLPGAVVAFSGGVDSTFLAVVTHEVLKERCIAVTAVSPTYPEHQLAGAKALAVKYGLQLRIINTDECETSDFTANSPDRCYYCKSALFKELQKIAAANNFVVLDGANVDDLGDHRPGHRAAKEFGVRSLLQEVGLTKAEIRQFSKTMNLPTWDKPAYACLASRLPYGQNITLESLNRIDQGEQFLTSLGLREVRLRDHNPVARIEVNPREFDLVWRNRAEISSKLHSLGFPYVALDLDGFRSGSMNEVLGKK